MKSVIGDYSVMFQKRSEFLFKALEDMHCMAVRKSNFIRIHDKFSTLTAKLKLKVFMRYRDLVRRPTIEHLQETIEQIKLINKQNF